MKTQTLALAITGAAVLLALKAAGALKNAGPSALGKEIKCDGKPCANGWKYFDGGYAINPDGQIFDGRSGQQVGGGPTVKTIDGYGIMGDEPRMLSA